MFLVAELTDRVKLSVLSRNKEEEVKNALTRKYTGRMVEGLGAAVHLLKVLRIHEYKIIGSFLAAKASFHMLFFKALRHEILSGRIVEQSAGGLTIRVPFHGAIAIPACNLPENSAVEMGRSAAWIWTYKGNRLPLRTGDEVRARVENEEQSSIVASFNEAGLGVISWWI
jgi:DNA-directed RNA polymerase subunit E'/Rpb7